MKKGYLRILRATTACLAVTICLHATAHAGSGSTYSYYGKDVTAGDIITRFLDTCSGNQGTAACKEAAELSAERGIFPFRSRGIRIRGQEVKKLETRTFVQKTVRVSTAAPSDRSHHAAAPKRASSQHRSSGCPHSNSAVALPVTFALNSAILQSEAYTKLRQMAMAMKSSALHSCQFAVEGHTDASGNADFNLQLSKERAYAVKEFLVSMKIDPSRLMTVGKGESEPLAHSDPRAPENRRVQFRIVQK
jgi:outer membrane protein OmpA-like peptidoglycan-associated protein